MEDVGRVVHAVLEGAVGVWECFCAAAEAHVLAEVVAALVAVAAVVAHDAGLDGDALAGDEVLHAWPDGGDDTRRLVSEYERLLHHEVAVTAVHVVVD